MKEILCNLSKETRCFIMSAILFFEGFKKIYESSEIHGIMLLDVLGLTKEDMEDFHMPDYSQLVSNLKTISDPEIRHWIITNTYSPVLQSQSIDALKTFKNFCSDLNWDAKEIRETMDLTEELEDLKPIDIGAKMTEPRITSSSSTNLNSGSRSSSGSGCLVIFGLIIISTAIISIALI